MKLTVNVWERVRLLAMVRGVRDADLGTIRLGTKALDALELTDEERAVVGYYATPQGAGWEDGDHQFVIELDEDVFGMVLATLDGVVRVKNEESGWAMQDAQLIPLCEKLGVSLEGDDAETEG